MGFGGLDNVQLRFIEEEEQWHYWAQKIHAKFKAARRSLSQHPRWDNIIALRIAEVLLTEYSVLKCVSFVSHLMYKSRFCDPPGVNAVRLPFLLELWGTSESARVNGAAPAIRLSKKRISRIALTRTSHAEAEPFTLVARAPSKMWKYFDIRKLGFNKVNDGLIKRNELAYCRVASFWRRQFNKLRLDTHLKIDDICIAFKVAGGWLRKARG